MRNSRLNSTNRYTWICVSSIYPRHVYMNFTMASLFRENCKVMYTDTNSFIYYCISSATISTILWNMISTNSILDYAIDNAYCISLANKIVPSLNENNGTIMTEFVGLRVKMYALRVDGKKDTKKAKNVKIILYKAILCILHAMSE